MISAAAARKAALAAQKPPDKAPSPIHVTHIPPPTPARTNSKRKSLSQLEKKKFKKRIVVDSGESSDQDIGQNSVNFQLLGERVRSFGDSDSSDDSMEVDDEERATQFDISAFFNNKAHQEPQDENRLLSTLEPSPDQNMFFLTAEEQSTLNLSERATIIALNAQDSLCLLGTCNLTILHGSITLCGITLLASSTKHPIYAPRSSPLPIIKPSSKTTSILKPETLSPRLVKILEFKAVIVLQELRTNVEELGRVCRSFEGVFEPTKWQKNVTSEPFEVPGLYMVRLSFHLKFCIIDTIIPLF
jgi:polynucleotide 5'-hydroxyl-kinase GRC3/NOL9